MKYIILLLIVYTIGFSLWVVNRLDHKIESYDNWYVSPMQLSIVGSNMTGYLLYQPKP